MTDTATTSETGYEPDPRRWKALSVTLVAGFMSLLDVSIVAVALPSIQRGLGTSPAAVQWVVSGYALTFGLALVPAGRLGDAIGRRTDVPRGAGRLRAVQRGGGRGAEHRDARRRPAGAGDRGGLARAAELGADPAAVPGRRARAGRSACSAPPSGSRRPSGPIVGGAILAVAGEPDGWRWIFYVNVPIGVVALVLAARLIPRVDPGPRQRADLVGAGLLGGGVLALMLPLVLAEAGGLARLWWLFPVGAVVLVGFVWWERRIVARGRPPLLDVRLLTGTPGYASGALLGTVYFIGFSGIWLVFALYLQSGLGFTPLQSGLSVTAFALGAAASAVVGGRLVTRWGRRLTVIGLRLVVLGLVGHRTGRALAPPDRRRGGGWRRPCSSRASAAAG